MAKPIVEVNIAGDVAEDVGERLLQDTFDGASRDLRNFNGLGWNGVQLPAEVQDQVTNTAN